MRIGVYVCHCGSNIAGTVRVSEVAEFARSLPNVTIARDYLYMCSEPGLELVKSDITEFNLDRIVIAACSPAMHQATFMNEAERVGLNPYCLERANIREQCSWVHADSDTATQKARDLLAAAVVKASLASVSAAAAASPMPDDFRVSITNPPGKGAYPIASFTWLLIPTQIQDADKREAIKEFLDWMLTSGQRYCEGLGYAKLPMELVSKEMKAIALIR